MGVFYRMHMIEGGEFAGVTAYPVFQESVNGLRRRRPRCNPTKEAQAYANKKRAEEYFFYLVHQNFTIQDNRLDLDFAWDRMPGGMEALKRVMRNFIQRLRRLYRRHGLELKLIWIPEATELGRYHIHGFINGGVPPLLIQKIWRHGRVNTSPFQYDREGLAAYIHYVFKAPLGAKKWNATKNLLKPKERVRNYAMTHSMVDAARRGDYAALEKALPGWEVVDAREEWEEPSLTNWAVVSSEVRDNEVTALPYVYIKLCRSDAKLSW